MDKLRALGRGTQIMFVAAVLLLIDSFFRWQEISYNLGALGSGSAGRNAWHGFWGVVMGILTIILVARIAARLAAVDVPIPLSFATTSFVLGVLIAICAVLKVITDDYRTFWAFLGAGLAIVVAVGAWLEVQEAGGLESLKNDATNLGSSVGGGAATSQAPATQAPATEPPAPPPAAEPPPTQAAPPADSGAGAADAAAEAAETGPQVASAPAEGADTASDAANDEPSSEHPS
jgi:hypothetical protein